MDCCKLKNGATVLSLAWDNERDRGVVLAYYLGQAVTWMASRSEKETDGLICEAGHYFLNHSEARADYLERVRLLIG